MRMRQTFRAARLCACNFIGTSIPPNNPMLVGQRASFMQSQPSSYSSFFNQRGFMISSSVRNEAVTVQDCQRMRVQEGICWKCGKPLTDDDTNFCPHCTAVQPPNKDQNYFSVFGFKEDYDINLRLLQKSFTKLQIHLHPDKFTMKSSVEQQLSEQASSHLNKAYSTLLDPLQRALYMLELHGVIFDESTTSANPSLLMDMMDLNEEVEDAEGTETRRSIYDRVKDQLSQLRVTIAAGFRQGDIDDVKENVIMYKYYDNVQQKLKEMLPPL